MPFCLLLLHQPRIPQRRQLSDLLQILDNIGDSHRTKSEIAIRQFFLSPLHRQATIRNSSHHKRTEINSNNYLQYTSKSMCTIIHSTEALMASLSAPSTCFVARGDVRPAELNCCIYSIIFRQLLYAYYDVWLACLVSVQCATLHLTDLIVAIFHFPGIFLTFCFFSFRFHSGSHGDACTYMPLIH
jgi:hypothetical protein